MLVFILFSEPPGWQVTVDLDGDNKNFYRIEKINGKWELKEKTFEWGD